MDDTLPMMQMEAMLRHLRSCTQCARHDTAVRRSLLIVRNLPEIEPSADFMARLNERLSELHVARELPQPATTSSFVRFAAIAAGLAIASFVGLDVISRSEPEEIRLAPVIASLPEQMPSPVSDAAFVASMSAGIPVWPAVLMLDQAPMHMANLELQQASYSR